MVEYQETVREVINKEYTLKENIRKTQRNNRNIR